MQVLSVIVSLLFIVVAVAMILVILIQRPQGGGLAGAFGGGGGSQSAFGAKTGDMLTWATVAIFVLFLGSAMGMVWINQALYLSGQQTRPAAPDGLVVTALTSSSVELTWNDNSDNEVEFFIERSDDGVTGWTILTTVEADRESFVDTNLTPETEYFYRVTATNGQAPSQATQAVPVTTPELEELPDAAPGMNPAGIIGPDLEPTGPEPTQDPTGTTEDESADDQDALPTESGEDDGDEGGSDGGR